MADLEKTVKILFEGDDQVSNAVNSMAGNVSNFTDLAGNAAAPWADLADNILMVDAALAALAVGGLAYAFERSTEFESSILELQKVLGDTEDINIAIGSARELSNQYGESANDILGSMAGFRQAGFDLSESLTLTKDSLDLVIAGNIDAEQSSQLIIAALKGFGEGADEARRYIDILNETSNNYATDVQQLAEGMSRISPIANQMGFSMEEMAGLLTPVIEIFGSGSEAADGLKTGLLKLVDDAAPVREALASIGVSQFEANGQMRAGRDIYLDVARAFLTLDENQKLFVTQQLVGIEQSARMVQVFDNLGLSTEITANAMGSAGSAAREVALRLESAEVTVNRFKVGFENLAVTIGDQFRESARGAIAGGVEIENALSGIIESGTFEPIFARIRQFSNDLGDLLETIARNIPEAFEGINFDDLFSAFDNLSEGLGEAFNTVFSDVDLTTVEGLRDVIQRVIDGLAGLVNVTSGIVDGLRPVFEIIGFGIDQFENMEAQGQQLAGVFLGIAQDIRFLTDNLDLFRIALVPIAGASMINAIANMVNFGSGILGASSAMSGAGGLLANLSILATHPAFAVLGSAAVGVGLGTAIRNLTPEVDNLTQRFFRLVDSVINFSGQQGNVSLPGDIDAVGVSADGATTSIRRIPGAIQEIPDQTTKTITYDGVEYTLEQFRSLSENAGSLGDIEAEVNFSANTSRVTESANVLKYQLEDGTWAEIEIAANQSSIESTKQRISSEIDPLKRFEIETELDIAQLEAATQTIQSMFEVLGTSIEWEARIDIAQIEADAETTIAAFESIGQSVDSVSNVVSSMFSDLADLGNSSHFYELFNVLQREMTVQEDLVAAQIRLIDAQINRMEQGEALWTISGENMSEAAMGFMYAIMNEIKVQNHADGGTSLMGLPQ